MKSFLAVYVKKLFYGILTYKMRRCFMASEAILKQKQAVIDEIKESNAAKPVVKNLKA